MNYKLSNTASKTVLEMIFDVPLKYPNIYTPKKVIDGLKEQSIALISMDNPKYITEGIWGILPQNFEGDWKNFQNKKTTLHTEKKDILKNILYKEALQKRRCLILVTGFYMYRIIDNDVVSFLVEKEKGVPFCLAGLYNILEDGFITCTVINTETNTSLNSDDNLYNTMPLEIPQLFRKAWLHKETPLEDVERLISKPYLTQFKVEQITA